MGFPKPLLLIALGLFVGLNAFRLNVPRVLLPYHPSNQVTFLLEVSHPGGACFSWRSTRPDVASIEPIDPKANGCSDKALLTSRSKHADEQSATIFARDLNSGVTLSCGVSVDVIHSIKVETITDLLFLEAPPARMYVDAFNAKGHAFSALGDIPFDWSFEFADSSRRPLRIIPFSQSKYDAPPGIEDLEKQKKKGYVVLVEGIQTGAAKLTARFSESDFSYVAPHGIELYVVANLLLIPSEDLFVTAGSVIPYSAVILKQGATEPVPKDQYELVVSDPDVCSLDPTTNYLTANALGNVEVTLYDTTVKQKAGFKPQSAHVYVVEPDSIFFTISRGNNWVLQAGLSYEIEVKLLDLQGKNVFIPENARFETDLSDHFEKIESSKNGTYFKVRAKRTGQITIKSHFTELIDVNGYTQKVAVPIYGEQKTEIFDPIDLTPKTLIFPYQRNYPYNYKLKVKGGSGVFVWSTENKNIAGISESGVVSSGEIGETIVHVADYRNEQHRDISKVIVIEPKGIEFGPSVLEAEIGTALTLNIKMFTELNGSPVPFTDCRNFDFTVQVSNQNVFKVDKSKPGAIPEENRGCSTIHLVAKAVGDSKITVSYGSLKAQIDIFAFPPLKITVDTELLLGLGSSAPFKFEGGPRPFTFDPSKYYAKVEAGNGQIGEIENTGDVYRAVCKENIAETTVSVKVGNRRSTSLPFPAQSVAQAKLCCSVPSRIALTQRSKAKVSKGGNCPTSTHSVFFGEPSYLELSAFGHCSSQGEDAMERKFSSVSSLVVDFRVKQTSLASIDRFDKAEEQEFIYAVIQPSGRAGVVDIQASTSQFDVKKSKKSIGKTLSSHLTLNLVDKAAATPTSIVLWNQKEARGVVTLVGGSGHFWIDYTVSGQYVNAHLLTNPKEPGQTQIQLSPIQEGLTKLVVHDLCIGGHEVKVDVKVTEISEIRIRGAEFVEVQKEVPLEVVVIDVEGQEFALEDIQEINLNLEYNNDLVSLDKQGLLTYNALGVKVGVTQIIVFAISATGKTVRSTPHHLQVFAPLILDPREVTLIPQSVFQLEIIGGPQPIHPVNFEMNNTAIASISSNGLIHSTQTLGYSSIKGVVGYSGHTVTSDTVILKVVSLAGVRIVVSSSLVETGEVLEARVEGIAGSDESPFAFGGADYPLTVEWKLSKADSEILNFEPVMHKLVREKKENQFATQLRGLKSGIAELEVKVTAHSSSYRHFLTRESHFNDVIKINVHDPVNFVAPFLDKQPTIRVTPLASLPLSINRPVEEVVYKASKESEKLFGVKSGQTADGIPEVILESGSLEGVGAILVEHNNSVYNNSHFVTVEVTAAKSIHLTVDGNVHRIRESLIPGNWITVHVGFRDNRGRVLHAARNKVSYRPHRFDLTEIESSDDRRTLRIYLKYDGETVLKVWDPKDHRIATFLRLSVADLSPEELKDEADTTGDSNLTLGQSYNYVKQTADEAKSGIGRLLGEFFDNNPGISIMLMFSFAVATLFMFVYYACSQRQPYVRPSLNSSRVYAYQTTHDGSLGLSTDLSASPLFHSTPDQELAKKAPATSRKFATPVNKAYVDQSSPRLSNKSAGSSHDELFNGSISPNNRLKQVVSRFYN
ncbi:unnamed protein product [Bursaphelenchus xylophilus]|uniref:(pine wood nematode) hypothetical protein n=1 Tax=Bursaphelenchus xylophilus TaxID=6326 RepID=A0A1I7RRI9_BURXY|nr:unnamed protein product [Bursaphelenchus xylophilus]CAG9131072.1 unnamed protein product [Bursaphelenchus xylophilus]